MNLIRMTFLFSLILVSASYGEGLTDIVGVYFNEAATINCLPGNTQYPCYHCCLLDTL